MGGCLSTTVTRLDDTARPYSAPWPQPALGGGLYSGGLGASTTSATPAYTTTANVGLGRGEERRVYLHDHSPGGPQLPRIEEDQALQGGEPSPTKPQLSGLSRSASGRQVGPANWTRGELIGQGAFGSVYLGMDNDTGQLMAVKQVNISKVAERGKIAEHIKGLEAEVHLLQQLNHPNIVRYLGTESTDGALNIFLEYVPGGSIASLLAKFGSFRESVIKVYTKQILLGLEYLHKNGIMHRDIKGANILVDNTGLVKLADFGASKKIEGLVTIDSGHKSVKGTPYWMAPEVITQTGHGRQADIWSVACTVIEMATGKPPWSQCGSQVSAMFQIAQSKGPPTIPENLSADCKDFLYLCFNRNYKERPSASRLLQHPFLADVVCRTLAAPLNNIANMVQEPAIKAWRLPKDVRVPSPMREESEGAPFSTPSPMHPRMQEKKAGGGARISIATSQATSQLAADGEQTPGSRGEQALSPLGQHMARSRRDFAPPPTNAAPAGRQQQQRSPTKRPAVRSSAPVFGGYAAAALAPEVAPEPLERLRGPIGNSQASTVHPRTGSRDLQQEAPSSGAPTRESSLGMDATLRVSNSSLRLSREPSAAAALAAAAAAVEGPLGDGQPMQLGAEVAGSPLETPVPLRKAAPDRVQLPDSNSQGPAGQEGNTPSTADSRGTFKSDYNPMEEPTWMHPSESPLQASPPPPAAGASPSKASGAGAVAPMAASESAQPQQPAQQQQQQQHMVWMDDDGSIDALPWDMGSWSVGSGDVSPGAGPAPQPAGEPVDQDVLISALNRRAHLEVRASLALFESTMSRLNAHKGEGTPSPPKPSPPRPSAAATAAPAPLLSTSLRASGPKLAAALSKEDLTALVDHPKASALAAAEGDKRRSLAPAPAAFPAPGVLEDGTTTTFGAREAVWEQELSRELRQLPSQAGWRYQSSAGRRMSMHGSPQKVPHQ